ncbi:MAG: Membrane protein involved in the export of O-antigen, teichoic acid lipoteichoic acids [uncultured Sulfurovum sp.]|uniref:Membrane protein involved in the export of O-antigen, teichoic acid lipoteichoic acids n=1 Tax=uncultured Sulfurovum sp. TaxID=269237 RepID=A0A6S6TAS0_9BACT|nr:MAG: Membrane protein involved in the export of O-antigen, teichoic acid lipoteichoic acids [uncultured Sulfurovum sp.]
MKIQEVYDKYKTLFHNLSYMTILKIFMLVLPLISYPYLIRVVGSESFGIVVYILSITAFFRIFVKFGFEMSSVKNVAENSENKDKLSKIISSVLTIQVILYILGFIVLYALIRTISQFEEHTQLLYYAYLLPLADILLLVWFFQGIEKMKYITIINVISGLIGLVFIFIFIQDRADYIYIPLLQAISLLIGSVYSLWFVFRKENIIFKMPAISDLIFYTKESFPFVISRASAIFNIETNTILLGNFVSMSAVAYYDLAKKIIEVFKMPNSIINQVFYPYIAKTKDKVLAKKVFYIRILISIVLISIVFIFGKHFVLFLGGSEMLGTLEILNIFSIMLVLTAITYYTGSTLLVSFGYANKFNVSVLYSTGLYLGVAFLLYITNNITIYNILYLMILVECYIVFYRYYYCKRYYLL